ncbi:hypothetical protein C8R45DRAFT_1095731 [Mycena sanguinolenta]|nr:hypothetical protein C8R45DRAFT_1095731 [Mycena sanguinolenta]
MITTQIERARSLNIHFFGSESRKAGPQIAVFELLAEHSGLWEDLSIQLTSELLPSVMDLDLTPLRRAWMQWDTAESQPPGFDSVDFFRMAVSLVDITVYCEYRFLSTRLPVRHQLTRYDFDAPWKTHRELLKSLPALEEVRVLRDFDDIGDSSNVGEPIDLVHLRRLFVSDPTTLDHLRAPALEEIAFQPNTTDSEETCHSLEQFLVRSSCSPGCLRIQGLLAPQSTAAIFQKFPHFTEVAVTDMGEEDEDTQRDIISAFLTLFSISNSTPSALVLPHITKIGLACENADALLCPLFLTTLESRWNAAEVSLTAAELLLLDPAAHPDRRSVARIETLREAGLEISLMSGRDASSRIDRWLHRAAWT